ncbi:cyclopropane-fatty-acyl-phospholipid synthase family protein [Geminicoccaceae bacterium 1502E]|nr:cyclopropane-fatty-acyl-phospholipid synthase family protein [Geminicoccaceae bacterium 1502E]
MLIDGLLRRHLRLGELTVIDASGGIHTYRGEQPLHRVRIRLHDRRVERRILLNAQMAVPDAYVDGSLTIEEGSAFEFFDLCVANVGFGGGYPASRLADGLHYLLRRLDQLNLPGRARRNVAHHYDLSGALYGLFLDSEREYSCAYFTSPDGDLEAAQRAKERHIAAKLLVEPGHKIADIGCGWGALGRFLARECGAEVTGVTLSAEQHRWGTEQARAQGLGDRLRILKQDYRQMTGVYDRLVSVGMIEHVGVGNLKTYFEKVRDLLAPDGVALIHGIGRMAGPSFNHPWLRKHIFPGSYAPALSELLPAIEAVGLWVTDLETLRLHYAWTLRWWRERFYASREKVRALYDERFCRMWEVYLIATELFFSRQDGFVFQVQLARDRHAVPVTRDYMYGQQARPAAAGAAARAAE